MCDGWEVCDRCACAIPLNGPRLAEARIALCDARIVEVIAHPTAAARRSGPR